VREATVFRRPFLEDGPSAQLYAPAGLGTKTRPTGIVAAPVCRGEAVDGVILAIREDDGGWPDSVTSLIELVAFFVGRDIERIRLLHQAERYLLREGWYHRMVRKMAQVGSEEGEAEEGLPMRRQRVYAEAVGQLRRMVGASRALLIGTSDGGKTGWITWEEADSGAGGSDRPEPLGESYVGWVIRTGSRRILSESRAASRSHDALPPAWVKEGERSFLLLPVAGVGGFRGAVVCCHEEEERFHRQHAEIARDITEVMQLGLSHVGHLEELAKRAATDGLTGLANRKSFLQRLEAELARLDGRHPLAVVMMDIDHFKRINDTHGHPFGDEVLRGVSAVLGKAIRRGDAVGRYGGEEFVLYLPMADPVKALEGAERFRRMIRQTKFHHNGREVAVTASFGVSCAPGHGNSAEELLSRADEALYLSKQRGRDRVTMYPG
jgi:diguanylate cyclase (GGDEF)-like protein